MVFHLFILPLRRFSTVSTTSMSTTSYIEVGQKAITLRDLSLDSQTNNVSGCQEGLCFKLNSCSK